MGLKAFVNVLLLLSAEVFGQTLPQDWKRIGEAELSILWFDVYRAELLSANGRYAGDKSPLILKLDYRRNISKRDLLDETEKQLKKFAPTDTADLWLSRLSQIWPDIRNGDQLAFWIDEKNTGHFFYNENWLGSVNEAEFSSAFIQIWLSDNSSYPDLARQLRGSVK